MEILNSAVCRQLSQAGLPLDWITKFPYSVVASDEAESIFQLMDSEGIADFLDGKVRNAEFAGWEWSGYSRHRIPHVPVSAAVRERVPGYLLGCA
jgi:hypothetical protein